MNTDVQLLYNKLDQFIRKYYLNELIKGSILSGLFILSYILIISFSEYFLWLSVLTRTIVFYLSIVLFLFLLYRYIFLPILHFCRKGKILSHKSASYIISKHFPEIQDKLYNTLELSELLQNTDNSLIIASIEQRISALKPLPFTFAINYKANYKYSIYLLSVLLFALIIFFLYPNIYVDGTNRVLQHSTFFEKSAPFNFDVNTDSLHVKKGSDYKINVKISGDYVPSIVELQIGSNTFLMSKDSKTEFSYTIKNVNNSISFRFNADTYSSKSYTLNVLNVPKLYSFKVQSFSPHYTGVEDLRIENVGDFSVPLGSKIVWDLETFDTDSLIFIYDSLEHIAQKGESNFTFEHVAKKSISYKIVPKNKNFSEQSSVTYSLTVIPDVYPEIFMECIIDSINPFIYYYKGKIRDDYGFSLLHFVVKQGSHTTTVPININNNLKIQEFYYVLDLSSYKANGDVEYYFEIFDNDAINKPKSSKSEMFKYNIPSEKELAKLKDESYQSLNDNVDKTQNQVEELQNDLKKIKKKLLESKLSDFEKKNILSELQKKQHSLNQMLEKMSQEQFHDSQILEKLTEQKPEILEKQKQLQDLLEKMMNPELEKLLEEFNKLKDALQNDKMLELAEKLDMSYEDLENQLDKNIELFKRFEVEQKIENSISNLQKLAEEQKNLADSLKQISKEDMLQKQKSIDDKSNSIKQEYTDALKKNEQLEQKMNLEDFESQFDDIKKNMEDIANSIQNDQKKKSKDSMQKNSEQMDNLAQQMESMMQQNESSQSMEDMNSLRQILDNIVTFSFDQEMLLEKVKRIDNRDPKYFGLSVEQNTLKENFKIIKDSLYALAKRNPQINTQVTKEIFAIQSDMAQSISALEQMFKSNASVKQQYVVTSVNNLALLLDNILKNMQQSAAQKMAGQQQCQNPNSQGKGQSLSQMKQQQQSMKSQLQQMIDQMKQNQKPGKGSPGLSKQLSQMLSQQEQQQKMLQDLMNNSSFNPETMQKLKEIKQMIDQNEKDIVNRNLSTQTMFRQNQIVTRLLEAENAERQREYDNKRESNEGKELYSNPKEKFKYKDSKLLYNQEDFEYSNLKLSNFYRKKFTDYIININSK